MKGKSKSFQKAKPHARYRLKIVANLPYYKVCPESRGKIEYYPRIYLAMDQ